MRASLKNYMAACNRRKEETGESGFSLIELIVVVVILGILAAIAVPVFTGLQAQAEDNARATVAANAATQVASNLSQNKAQDLGLNNLRNGTKYTITIQPTSGATITDYCVTVAETGKESKQSGPSCTAAPTTP
ncbi:prepilin-type N-terminal cleavage/methylation domain-containing protein [Microbacterium sp. LKL04]|uniref:type IV pilin protein n=1 Tax=Microbacterium sp. LKL04 TaxID=912630 RepID=UPI000875B7A5|nr:prepilin-type N-terminal cleavage/methylation domain-containing protein [Microbacterium sp. LKL04]SCY54036.1 prepilin-type N-terminal cleavage/methylation domain-containing protein [Microbacterium sp. LKL04]